MDMLQEKIAKRAFDLFVARGGQHGYHIQDWLQAEQETVNAAISSAEKKSTVKKIAADASVNELKAMKPKVEKPASAKKVAVKK